MALVARRLLGFLIRSVTCRDRYRVYSSVWFVGFVQRFYIVCGDSKEEVRFDVMLGASLERVK